MNKKELFDQFQKYVADNIIDSFDDSQREKFEIYFDNLLEWNQKFNLIHFKAEEDILYRHFADSLYAVKAFNSTFHIPLSTLKVVDLGTGSGMPGIPFKIAMPDVNITLVESITKKCAFLDDTNQKLGFDIKVLNERAEAIGQSPNYRQRIDIVLSRAVSKFSPNLEIAIPLLKVGGYFIVHKTKNSAESLEEGLPSVQTALKHLGAKLEMTLPYKLPNNDMDYCILAFKKYKDTPAEFPRKVGIPEKNPL